MQSLWLLLSLILILLGNLRYRWSSSLEVLLLRRLGIVELLLTWKPSLLWLHLLAWEAGLLLLHGITCEVWLQWSLSIARRVRINEALLRLLLLALLTGK